MRHMNDGSNGNSVNFVCFADRASQYNLSN